MTFTTTTVTSGPATLINIAAKGTPGAATSQDVAIAELTTSVATQTIKWTGTAARPEVLAAIDTVAFSVGGGFIHNVTRTEFATISDLADTIANTPPSWGSPNDTVFQVPQGGTLNLNNALRFTDADNNPLTISQVSGSLPLDATYDSATGVISIASTTPVGLSEDLVFSADDGQSNVLLVGPSRQYKTIRSAILASKDRDIIQVDAGDYIGDVATINADNLTIRGVGGRARLFANGVAEAQKGIWVVNGNDFTCENIDFHDCTVVDQNGSGIRGDGAGLLWVKRCGFFNNDDGILTGGGGTVLIEFCEFDSNGWGDGQSHNVYIYTHQLVTVRDSYFHSARVGHEFKCRAKETLIERCYLSDGPSGTASYVVNMDNGGRLTMRGCMLYKSNTAQNSFMIFHNTNTWGSSYNSITLEHCTLVHNKSTGSFINLASGSTVVTLTACVFASNGRPLVSGATPVQNSNYTTTVNMFPGASDLTDPDFLPDVSIIPALQLPSAVVPTYLIDEPHIYTQRVLSAPPTVIGALQDTSAVGVSTAEYFAVPSLQDEIDYYANPNKTGGVWNWTAADMNFVGFSSSPDPLPPYGTGFDIHGDWEGDNLATWQWQATRGYQDPALVTNATQRNIPRLNRDRWLTYMKTNYLVQLQSNNSNGDWTANSGDWCHIFLHGLCMCGVQMNDSAAITAAEDIFDYILPIMRVRHPGWPNIGSDISTRPLDRQLISLCHLVQATGKQKWIDLRDQFLDTLMAAPNWTDGPSIGLVAGCGAYFRTRNEMTGNNSWHLTAADYDRGGRVNAAIYTALETEALWLCWLQTKRSDIRTRLVQYARYIQNYAHHPAPAPYPLCGYVWGVMNGAVYKCGGSPNPNDPPNLYTPWADGYGTGNGAYDAEVVNALVRAYRFTGDTTFLDRAKIHHRQATRWAEGQPGGNPATSVPLNEVRMFIDTNYHSATIYYFTWDKGQLQHTFEIFANGGNPSLIP